MNTRVLLIYPKIPDTYWSFSYILSFLGKKSLMPPLGLITVAAMLPEEFEIKLIDMNVEKLTNNDVMESDIVFISSMIVQKESFEDVVKLCNECGKPVVAGGPYPTSSYENIEGVSHFVLNEAEITMPQFLEDYKNGNAKKVYQSNEKPDLSECPLPRFDLLKIKYYSSMPVQASRGCPFKCEFCDIIELFGRVPRYKSEIQFLKELDAVYDAGFKGSLFVVDDNFIGNKSKVKSLLKEIISWQKFRNYPFNFFTEASIDLAIDEELMDLLVEAGFNRVFVGIETPDNNTLKLVNKKQNTKLGLMESVEKIQKKGIEVMAGFIVGFDSDTDDIFDRQIDFIQKAGIPVAMIGILLALPGTQLYRRLKAEGRLTGAVNGNNTHNLEVNFDPIMDRGKLIDGYKKVLFNVYDPKLYFERSISLIKRIPKKQFHGRGIEKGDLRAFFTSLIKQTFSSYGIYYLKFLIKTMIINIKNFPTAVNIAVKGYHLFKMTEDIKVKENFLGFIDKSLFNFESLLIKKFVSCKSANILKIEKKGYVLKQKVMKKYLILGKDLQIQLNDSLIEFEASCNDIIAKYVNKTQRRRKVALKNLSYNVQHI